MVKFLSRLQADGTALFGNSDLKVKEDISLYKKSNEKLETEIRAFKAGLHPARTELGSQEKELALLGKLDLRGQQPGFSLTKDPDAVVAIFILTERHKILDGQAGEMAKISLFIPSILTESKVGYVKMILSKYGHAVSQPYIRKAFINAGVEEYLAKHVALFFRSISDEYPSIEVSYKRCGDLEMKDVVLDFFSV